MFIYSTEFYCTKEKILVNLICSCERKNELNVSLNVTLNDCKPVTRARAYKLIGQ